MSAFLAHFSRLLICPSGRHGGQTGCCRTSRKATRYIESEEPGNGGEAATIEFAVVALGVKDIIICGHSHCGAVQGLLQPEHVAALPALSSWLSHAETTRRIIRDNYGHLDGDRLLTAAVEENVLVQLENLRTHPAVGSRLARGDLHLHGWVYKIETGEVFAYDVGNAQFVKLTEYHPQSETGVRQQTTHVI